MEPLAEIVEIYDKPLTEDSNITFNYSIENKTRNHIAELKQSLDGVVNSKRAELGVEHIRPINLPVDKAEELRSAIKTDGTWIADFEELVACLAPDTSSIELEDQLDAIRIPWWNSQLLFRLDDQYDARGSLNIDAKISHSYISQLVRSGKLRKTGDDSMSISNILKTSDDLVILGWRGGHSFSNTIMTVPAGSVEDGENPLFDTLYAEHFEEVGLTRDKIISSEIIGRIFDYTLSNNSLYVFSSKTKLSFSELLALWGSSRDQREHKYLLAFRDDPQDILNHLQQNIYDTSKVDLDKPSATTLENVGTILPPCAASLLAYYAHKEGSSWGRKAEGLLNGAYHFK